MKLSRDDLDDHPSIEISTTTEIFLLIVSITVIQFTYKRFVKEYTQVFAIDVRSMHSSVKIMNRTEIRIAASP